MHLWKAWHDCRSRIVLYVLATVSIAVLSGLQAVTWANINDAYLMMHPYGRVSFYTPFFTDFRMNIPFYALRGDAIGYFGIDEITYVFHVGVLGYGPIVLLLTSLSLGAGSVGREYGAGTMTFVLTRPGQRWKFILTDWVVGLTGMVIILGGLAFPVVPFLCAIYAKSPGNVLACLPALWVVGAAIYALSHFTTLVAGSGSRGLVLSVAAILTYFFLPNTLHEWWHTDALLRATQWTLRPFAFGAWPLSPFDWGAIGFWLAVTAGLLGASVAWIRFREV